ncbi:unnamed protein product [Ciceribacter sp. T2.26MG-112.2]|jgi:hypothetical protein|nr:unnamed protein product [Ciceribacter naphthalenivorans]
MNDRGRELRSSSVSLRRLITDVFDKIRHCGNREIPGARPTVSEETE